MKKNEAVSTGKSSAFLKYAMAVGGMTLGIMLMLSGLLVWATSAIENQNHDRLELILIVAAFGFLGIGAHGLDLVNGAEREEKKREFNI